MSYAGPVVTVDLVALRANGAHLEVLIHKRQRDPFKHAKALPGVYMFNGETIDSVVDRCARTKAGGPLPADAPRMVVGVHDAIDRDPRGHSISIVVLAILGASALPLENWAPARGCRGLAFDHDEIVIDALSWLEERYWSNADIFRALVDRGSPSTKRILDVIGAATGHRPSAPKANLPRRLALQGFLRPAGFSESPDRGRGRPSMMWEWMPQPPRSA